MFYYDEFVFYVCLLDYNILKLPIYFFINSIRCWLKISSINRYYRNRKYIEKYRFIEWIISPNLYFTHPYYTYFTIILRIMFENKIYIGAITAPKNLLRSKFFCMILNPLMVKKVFNRFRSYRNTSKI